MEDRSRRDVPVPDELRRNPARGISGTSCVYSVRLTAEGPNPQLGFRFDGTVVVPGAVKVAAAALFVATVLLPASCQRIALAKPRFPVSAGSTNA